MKQSSVVMLGLICSIWIIREKQKNKIVFCPGCTLWSSNIHLIIIEMNARREIKIIPSWKTNKFNNLRYYTFYTLNIQCRMREELE